MRELLLRLEVPHVITWLFIGEIPRAFFRMSALCMISGVGRDRVDVRMSEHYAYVPGLGYDFNGTTNDLLVAYQRNRPVSGPNDARIHAIVIEGRNSEIEERVLSGPRSSCS